MSSTYTIPADWKHATIEVRTVAVLPVNPLLTTPELSACPSDGDEVQGSHE